MQDLITNRTQYNVARRATLSAKGLQGMTLAEKEEWLGDPFAKEGANLMPYGPNYSSVVDLKYTSSSITAKALMEGTYKFGVSYIGAAVDYENQIFTLSLNGIENLGGGTPMIALYWNDSTGYDALGVSLLAPGSITFDTANSPNTNNRSDLVMYVYVTTEPPVEVNSIVKFKGVMLEKGSVRHSYVPYTEVIATDATKGAYNYSDLNRVERAVAEISDLAGLNLVTKTDWKMWDIPTTADMNRYLDNIDAIRIYSGSAITLPSSMNNLTYNHANNIEQILLDAYTRIGGTG